MVDEISLVPVDDESDYLLMAECGSLLGSPTSPETNEMCNVSRVTTSIINDPSALFNNPLAFQQSLETENLPPL
jgi:hypothetical protein